MPYVFLLFTITMTLNSLNEKIEWWNNIARFEEICKTIWDGIKIEKSPLYRLDVSVNAEERQTILTIIHERVGRKAAIPCRCVHLICRGSEFIFSKYDIGTENIGKWEKVDSEFVEKFLDWLEYEINKHKNKKEEKTKQMLIQAFAWDRSEPILESLYENK